MTSVSPTAKAGIKLNYSLHTLELRHQFTLASGSRKTTPVLITSLEYQGLTGYGEASMPPFLGETHNSASAFLNSLDLSGFNDPLMLEDILSYVDKHLPGNYAAKASVDIALHDLAGKLTGFPVCRLLGLNPDRTLYTSYTIGIDKPDVIRQKVSEAEPFKILKVKLGGGNDREIIETIRSVTDKTLCVDVNQGWKDKSYALEMAHWLNEKGVIFIEQPLPAGMIEESAWLRERSPLDIIADEAIQGFDDLIRLKDVYSGVNVKLMKCGGIRSAFIMLESARKLGMKTLIGCMTETSCAVTAAAHLSPLADWCDLDGNLLINNDIFTGVKVIEGRISLPQGKCGLGIEPLHDIIPL